jgi:hypothetical protein
VEGEEAGATALAFFCFLELLVPHLDSENVSLHPIRVGDSRGEGGLAVTKEVGVFEEVEGPQGGDVKRVAEGEGRDISGIKEEEDLLERLEGHLEGVLLVVEEDLGVVPGREETLVKREDGISDGNPQALRK